MEDKKVEDVCLGITDDGYIKLYGTLYLELHTKEELQNGYECQIWNLLVDLQNVFCDYFGEDDMVAVMQKRGMAYSLHFNYPSIKKGTLEENRKTLKEKIKDGAYKIQKFFGL